MTVQVHVVFVLFQRKYKEAGKKGVASSLYCTLPETLETRHAKEASQLHSEVNTRDENRAFKINLKMLVDGKSTGRTNRRRSATYCRGVGHTVCFPNCALGPGQLSK